MKKPVLQRSMFIAASPKSESKGILTGIDDDDEFERSPDDLEIIANNLRGDMRSMDERYLELAQMVGEAAFDTPEEVLTLMQSQLAQQPQQPIPAPAPTQQGIGSLPPQGAPVPPQGGIASGMGEPAQMAHGGLVHRQRGSPPTGEISDLNERLKAIQGRPGLLSRMLSGAVDLTGNIDERVSNFLSRQLQTTGPATASGKPIPFVDKQGRFYQPVGGTNPNMPSRGFPIASKLNVGRLATRFGGPGAIIGGMATDALIESDPSRGQLYGSTFDLETGAGAEDRPGFATTRAVSAPGAAPPPAPPSAPEAAPENVPPPPPPARTPGASGPSRELMLPEKERFGMTPVGAFRPTETKDFRDRVREKMDVYKEFLGDDENMRKAQALFLLAESALNVAGATGRSNAERLSKGLKGLPAGMAAIGAEATKRDMAVKSAAISAVEQEIANENKIAGQIAVQNLKNAPKLGEIMREATLLQQLHNIDSDTAFFLAQGLRDGSIVKDDIGDLVDRTGRPIPGASRAAPSQPKDVGFLDPRMPGVEVTDRFLQRATAKQKGEFLERKQNNQEIILRTEEILRDVEGIVGPIPTIQAGITKAYLPFFGASGLGLTDSQKVQLRNNSAFLYERLMETYRRNKGRPSVFEQQEISKLVGKPEDFWQAPERVIGVLANISRDAMNDNARIDSMLNPGTPLKQLQALPLGTKDSPIPLGPNSDLLLQEVFRVRPNSQIYVTVGGKVEMIDGTRFRQQTQGGAQ